MAWIRVDDAFDEHPKMLAAGPLGWALWLAGLAYANRNLTDGYIPWSAARKLVSWDFLAPAGDAPGDASVDAGVDGAVDASTPASTPASTERLRRVYSASTNGTGARRVMTIAVCDGTSSKAVTADYVIGLLVSAGLWIEVDGGFLIHDYAEYQPLRSDVERLRELKTERQRRWRERRRASVDASIDGGVDASTDASVDAPVDAATQTQTQVKSNVSNETAAPPSDTPYGVYVRFLALKAADPATMPDEFKSKQLGAARNMLRAGYAADDIIGCAAYMQSQSWRTSPFDLTDVHKIVGKWVADGRPDVERPVRKRRADPIAEAQSLIAGSREPDRTGGHAGGIHVGPPDDGARGDRPVGAHVPRLLDGRTRWDVG